MTTVLIHRVWNSLCAVLDWFFLQSFLFLYLKRWWQAQSDRLLSEKNTYESFTAKTICRKLLPTKIELRRLNKYDRPLINCSDERGDENGSNQRRNRRSGKLALWLIQGRNQVPVWRNIRLVDGYVCTDNRNDGLVSTYLQERSRQSGQRLKRFAIT